MVSALVTSAVAPLEVPRPDVSAVVTEDDTPVDNFPSEKQQRLLTEPLFSSWSGPPPTEPGVLRPFVVAANVGLFATPKEPPLVPDVLLSLDVILHQDLWEKEHRSYFIWEFGKSPDVVIEVVSNREGEELGTKLRRYAWMRVPYYVVWDPAGHLRGPELRAFEMRGHEYAPLEQARFDAVGLGLAAWEGSYEGRRDRWLRWVDLDGNVVPTGTERAEQEHSRAEQEHSRAEQERSRAEQERSRAEQAQARAEQLAARLRALGIDPDEG